ncbi:chitobiase/beta-hexosaminidase C-terminal domain-containing protein [Saccharomonospora sp. NPDC046836]|uniref:cupredoxin domain-containing protein n=1 Tax=Saccharomonospora sp. NPDC046836 TaxID=3156921 RepID=UPI0033D5A81C
MAARRTTVGMLSMLLVALWVVPASLAEQQAQQTAQAAQQQVLTWTANDSITAYASVATSATAGAATIVFENSAATGNTTGMPHTLTFDTSTPGYNHDVNLNILASPFDANGGRYEVEVNLSPGQYRFYCALPGHGQMTGVLTVTEGGGEDTTAPTVSAQVSGDQDAQGNYLGSATVAIAAEDAESGVSTVEYQLNDGAFQPYAEPVAVTEPGDHTVRFRATDNAGNISEVGSVTFTVVEPAPDDTTPPEVSAEVTGTQDEQGNYFGSATVTVRATDTQSGVAGIEYEVDDRGFVPYTAPVRVSEIGDHSVQFRATDNAGNTSQVGFVTFSVVEPPPGDTTPPHVMAEVAGEQDEQGNYLGSATVTLTAHDAESGVDSVEYSLDGGEFTAYSEPFAVTMVGEHTVRHRATDHAGNTSEEGSTSFTVVAGSEDSTAPQVSAEVTGEQDESGDYVGTATMLVSAVDDESGVASIEYALDGGDFTAYTEPVPVTALGEHTARYRATDNAGNVSQVGSVTFTVVEGMQEDTTPPEVAVALSGEMDADWNYIESAKVTITAQDAESGVAAIEYSFNEGSFRPYRIPLTVADAGVYTVRYRATDNAGNTSEVGSATFTIVDYDNDSCRGSDIRETVIIGRVDTGIANIDTGNGCTINDLIAEDAEYGNHNAFVRHVREVTGELVAAGTIGKKDADRIIDAARRSGIGA